MQWVIETVVYLFYTVEFNINDITNLKMAIFQLASAQSWPCRGLCVITVVCCVVWWMALCCLWLCMHCTVQFRMTVIQSDVFGYGGMSPTWWIFTKFMSVDCWVRKLCISAMLYLISSALLQLLHGTTWFVSHILYKSSQVAFIITSVSHTSVTKKKDKHN